MGKVPRRFMRVRRFQAGLLAIAATLAAGAATTAQDWPVYRDGRGRFEFRYPPEFGKPETGTDDGFRDRLAAVRFSALTGLGGEAALIRGRVVVDVQAVGGLYDDITLQVFPEAMRARIEQLVPPLTIDNFCASLGVEDHLPAQLPFDARTAALVRSADRTRNQDPRVLTCDRAEGVVTFHKEATFVAGAVKTRQQIYGAVRFLSAPYSSFQFVRAGPTAPPAAELAAITRLVRSLTVKSADSQSGMW